MSDRILPSLAEEQRSVYSVNSYKSNATWIQNSRLRKLHELRSDVECIGVEHSLAMSKKERLLQRVDKDIEKADAQLFETNNCAIESMSEMIAHYERAASEDIKRFEFELNRFFEGFKKERDELEALYDRERRELESLIEGVAAAEALKQKADDLDYLANLENVRNSEIEESHSMRTKMGERINILKERVNAQLTAYQQATSQNSAEYKALLSKDSELSKQVEKKQKEVEAVQLEISDIKLSLKSNRLEWGDRNSRLKSEKEDLQLSVVALKSKMNRQHREEKLRLSDLTNNAARAKQSLVDKISLANKIMRSHDLARRLESQREQIAPFPEHVDLGDLSDLEFSTEERETALQALSDENEVFDELGYLGNFMRRFGRVKLENLLTEQRLKKLTEENSMLKSKMKFFLDSVSVSEDSMNHGNSLLMIKTIGDKIRRLK